MSIVFCISGLGNLTYILCPEAVIPERDTWVSTWSTIRDPVASPPHKVCASIITPINAHDIFGQQIDSIIASYDLVGDS